MTDRVHRITPAAQAAWDAATDEERRRVLDLCAEVAAFAESGGLSVGKSFADGVQRGIGVMNEALRVRGVDPELFH